MTYMDNQNQKVEEIIDDFQCCDRCYTTYTTDDYPAHENHDACINLNCVCHRPCNNECHFQEPYGFVPEAGCKIHDTP